MSFSMSKNNKLEADEAQNEEESLSRETSTKIQPVSNVFNQKLSFSFMSVQPSLGPHDSSSDDSSMILLSRIFFHKNQSTIGRTAVPLVLVEAFYAIKGLDCLVKSRVTRPFNAAQGSQQSSQTQPVLETCYKPSKFTGPTFVFRFYCRGENDIHAYQQSLKTALNDALLYFLSEYFTRVEPELYAKAMELKRTPVAFRRPIARQRHKSTNSSGESHDDIYMNRSARDTNLGKLIQSNVDKQLTQYVLTNFTNNLFDHRDYQDTIEYFREQLKNFDSSRILNSLINEPSSLCSSSEDIDDLEAESDADELPVSSNSSVSSVYACIKKRVHEVESDEGQAEAEEDETCVRMSYLRVLYEWLRGLYLAKQKSGASIFTRSQGSVFAGFLPGQSRITTQTAASPSIPPTPSNTSSFILRKKIYYKVIFNF